MANRIPRRCAYAGCNVVSADFPRGYCPEHEVKSKSERNAGRFYGAAWKRTRESIQQQNPFCAYVNSYGVRCRYPGVIAHHIIAYAIRPDLEHDQENLVMLCRACHNVVEKDELGARYTPTAFSVMGIVTQEDIGLMPGWEATREQEAQIWTLTNRIARFARETEQSQA